MSNFLTNIAPEIIYTLCGLVSIYTAITAISKDKKAIGTALFWSLFGITFIFGKVIPYEVTGIILVIMGLLTVTKQVKLVPIDDVSTEIKAKSNESIKSKIFIPAVLIGLLSFAFSFVRYTVVVDGTSMSRALDGAVMVGLACLVSLLTALLICKPKFKETGEQTSKLLMQVGAVSLLPQLLGALGTLFTQAGVGSVISEMIAVIVPEGNIFIGVLIYCIGMVVFTMIMGNAFAAFSVITVGIGFPFVMMQGGDPAVIGALGMTCGFCGTLLTPMAANFNIVPAAVLETKNKWQIIMVQVPFAVILIAVHVALMLLLAF